MKPILLKMTAFGPYVNEEIIDFSKLHEQGIFVVSGQTGAGKTTIFDAITFALYGAGSGEDRSFVQMLRSDFAEAKQDTSVELIFSVGSQTYKIWRSFNFKGSKKQEIHVLDNGQFIPAVEKQLIAPILDKIESILGLTKSQFNQIIMLPQGEYQKMLTSSSEEKEKIFRKMFQTDKYLALEGVLKGKYEAASKDYEKAEALQSQYISELRTKLPNPTIQGCFENGIIANYDGWRRMLQARNIASHTYNEDDALEIVTSIFFEYSKLLEDLYQSLSLVKLDLISKNNI